MSDVHRQTNVGEVEAVGQPDERQADNVVAHELLVVLARLLHAQHQDDGLLGPVRGLEQVVELEDGLVALVGETLVHAGGVEVPHGRPAHDVHAPGPGAAKVDGGVHLLHEAGLLAARPQAGVARQGAQQLLHDELAREGQDGDVEDDEGDVPGALGELRGRARGGVGGDGQLVAQEYEVVGGVGLARVDGVGGEEDGDQDGGQDPRVLEGVVGSALRQAPCLASLWLRAIFGVGCLQEGGEEDDVSDAGRIDRDEGRMPGVPGHGHSSNVPV